MSGEPDAERVLWSLREMIRDARARGEPRPSLHPALIPDATNAPRIAATDGPPSFPSLSFPTCVRPGPGGSGLVVADSGHHRILLLDAAGRIRLTIGGPAPGFEDGPLERARLRWPQGVIDGEDGHLYVADTGNHALRRVDLDRGVVETIAGTGWRGLPLLFSQPALEAGLASPWDLARAGDRLYFANAGTHQIGFLDLARKRIWALAGTGEENLIDGAAEDALFSQPTGLALDPAREGLWVVDAESSALRFLRLSGRPQVQTLVGRGLFTFGHRDGPAMTALMQHPVAVTLDGAGHPVVADAFNHALRRLDPDTGLMSTLPGDWEALLRGAEPRGVTATADGGLVVAATNHHRLLRLDPRSGTAIPLAGAPSSDTPATLE